MNIAISDNRIKNALLYLNCKDPLTACHSLDAARISATIYYQSGLHNISESDVINTAILHDIGKTSTPCNILKKPAKLDQAELKVMQQHPVIAYEMLINSNDPFLEKYAVPVRQHHERPDGSGYPDALHLEDIHPLARIINIADRYVAMRVDRPYSPARPISVALEEVSTDIMIYFPEKGKNIISALESYIPALPCQPPVELFDGDGIKGRISCLTLPFSFV